VTHLSFHGAAHVLAPPRSASAPVRNLADQRRLQDGMTTPAAAPVRAGARSCVDPPRPPFGLPI